MNFALHTGLRGRIRIAVIALACAWSLAGVHVAAFHHHQHALEDRECPCDEQRGDGHERRDADYDTSCPLCLAGVTVKTLNTPRAVMTVAPTPIPESACPGRPNLPYWRPAPRQDRGRAPPAC